MDLRVMEYAREVHRQGSFSKAAAVLRVAQPSLSQQIAKLEEEIGVILFKRGRSGAVPTKHGKRFLEQAEQILYLQEDLYQEMRERSQGMGSELVIGAPAITGGRVLPPLIRAFNDKYANTRVRLVEETTDKLEQLTTQGVTDLSVLALPISNDLLVTVPILTEPLFLAVPAQPQGWMSESYLRAAKDGLNTETTLREFSAAPFILLKNGYGFRHTVLALCAENGFQPEIAYETSSIETAQSLAAHGLGVTVIPAMVRRHTGLTSVYLRLDPPATRTLVFVYRKDRYLSFAARAFLEIQKELYLTTRQFMSDTEDGV